MMKSALVSTYGTRKRAKEQVKGKGVEDEEVLIHPAPAGGNEAAAVGQLLAAALETSARLLAEPLAKLSKRVSTLCTRLEGMEEAITDLTIMMQSEKKKQKKEVVEEEEQVVLQPNGSGDALPRSE